MKNILIVVSLVGYGFTSLLGASGAECKNIPVGMELAKTLEAKNIDQAKILLKEFKDDVKNYLDNCDNSVDKFEETSVMVLTYEDRLADFEADLKNNSAKKIDCSNVPDSKVLDKAFKEGASDKIKTLYETYKEEAQNYLDHCVAHEEYEMVFETSLLHKEAFAQWEKKSK